MKTTLLVIALLSLAGCAEVTGFINQSQSALEQVNRAKGLEAHEIICNRLYIKAFQELYTTKEQVDAWKIICKDGEMTP